ncbi:hypothetical protein [Lysobacter sp. A421]
MSEPLQLFSEPFAATGNMHGEGFRRLLGRPDLSLVQTVIRESLQNCVDAALGDQPTEVLLRLRTLAPAEREALRELAFSSLPGAGSSREAFEQVLAKTDIRLFEICDFNAVGLAGPTRADVPDVGNEPHNFVNFLRNVGASRDTHQGGGTYGYGKTSLYALSSCATILTDSLTTSGGLPVRRMMGCHLGEAFDALDDSGNRRRFTGRHWWGGPIVDGNLEPATGDHAVSVAEAIGLPVRPLGRSGTTVAILDPLFESETLDEITDELIETVLWNFWPRMTRSTPSHRRLAITLEVDGTEVQIPAPEDFPPLDLFSRALDLQRAGEQQQSIMSRNPAKFLGNLVVSKGMSAQRIGSAMRSDSAIPSPASHIALMRPVELVVKYLPGDSFADPRYEWAGVFICSDDDEVEAAFADAEPPAHDDWIPSNLPKGRPRTFVNVALTRLKEAARLVTQSERAAVTGSESGPSLAPTAAVMGRLLAGSSGRGPGRVSRSRRPPSTRKGVSITRPEFVALELGEDDHRIARFESELKNDGTYPRLRVVVEPHLVADGGRADAGDLPNEYQVALVELSLPSAGLATASPMLSVGQHSGTITIAVRAPTDAAAGVRARLEWDEGQ